MTDQFIYSCTLPRFTFCASHRHVVALKMAPATGIVKGKKMCALHDHAPLTIGFTVYT